MPLFRCKGAKMRLIPSKRVIEEFFLIYELKGCQKAVNFLAKCYRIRRMRIVVDGRKVGNGDEACYDYNSYTAFFTRAGLNKSNVLHELYHHLVNACNLHMSKSTEERKANKFARIVLKKL